MAKGIDQRDMARLNRAGVLRLIRRAGALCRSDLARTMHLTPTALTKMAAQLLDAGIIVERRPTSNGVGRPKTELSLRPDWAFAVTVSISHSLAVGVVDLAGQLVRHQKLATDQDGAKPYGRDLVRLLLPSVKGLLDGLTGRRVLGVGVIASGRVNRKGVIHWSENIPAPDLDMAKVLAPVTRLPVHTDEEFRLLLARLWAAETPPWRNAVIMSGRLLGFGGGQAAMIEGRIYYGCNGYAGQPGRCMAVLHGLDEIAAMKAWIASVGGESAYLDRVRQADPEALRVYAKCVDNYGFRIAQIANHFNPEVVLLYSPYSVLGQSFLDRVREVVRLHSEPWVTDGMEVRFAGERTDEARLAAAAGPLLDRVFVDGRLDPLIVGGRRNPHETPAQPTATPS